MELDKSNLLSALCRHIGRAQGVTAARLVTEICGTDGAEHRRRLRYLVQDLREEGHHICAHPKHGYFIAETDEELQETCIFLYNRAMCSLTQVAAMKRVSLPDLRGQLRLPT